MSWYIHHHLHLHQEQGKQGETGDAANTRTLVVLRYDFARLHLRNLPAPAAPELRLKLDVQGRAVRAARGCLSDLGISHSELVH